MVDVDMGQLLQRPWDVHLFKHFVLLQYGLRIALLCFEEQGAEHCFHTFVIDKDVGNEIEQL